MKFNTSKFEILLADRDISRKQFREKAKLSSDQLRNIMLSGSCSVELAAKIVKGFGEFGEDVSAAEFIDVEQNEICRAVQLDDLIVYEIWKQTLKEAGKDPLDMVQQYRNLGKNEYANALERFAKRAVFITFSPRDAE